MKQLSATPKYLLVLAICSLLVGVSWSADDNNKSDISKRIDASAKVLDEIMAVKDKAIPDKVMKNAKCIAVIPSMVKIAVGFGGNHGKGVATCRTEHGWSAPAPITITGGSWGLQLGGQAIDLVMVVQNDEAGADTDIKMKAEVLTYSRARGLFAGVDLSGAAVTQDKDETHLLYGKFFPFSDILSGKVEAPAASQPFLTAVRRYSEQSHESSQNQTTGGTESAAK